MSISEPVCRLCMGRSNLVHTVFEENLMQKIAICISVLINPDDKTLPLQICVLCSLKVKDFFEFRQNCLKVQHLLEQNRVAAPEVPVAVVQPPPAPASSGPPVVVVKAEQQIPKLAVKPAEPLPQPEVVTAKNSGESPNKSRTKPRMFVNLSENQFARLCPASGNCAKVEVPSDGPDDNDDEEEDRQSIEEIQPEQEAEPPIEILDDVPEAEGTAEDFIEPDDESYVVDGAEESYQQHDEEEDDSISLPREASYDVEMLELLSYTGSDPEQADTESQQAIEDVGSEPDEQLQFDSVAENSEDCLIKLEPSEIVQPVKTRKKRTTRPHPERSEKEIYQSLLQKCEICGKSIERNRMEGHRNQHLDVRPYDCTITGCNTSFHSKIALRLHTKGKHGTEELPCDVCGRIFNSKKALYHHKKETHTEKQFECIYCGLAFVSIARMNRHKITHTDQRDFKCPYCPKEFYRSNNLKVHLRSHTKEKPFGCELCTKAFGYPRLLREHMARQHKQL